MLVDLFIVLHYNQFSIWCSKYRAYIKEKRPPFYLFGVRLILTHHIIFLWMFLKLVCFTLQQKVCKITLLHIAFKNVMYRYLFRSFFFEEFVHSREHSEEDFTATLRWKSFFLEIMFFSCIFGRTAKVFLGENKPEWEWRKSKESNKEFKTYFFFFFSSHTFNLGFLLYCLC